MLDLNELISNAEAGAQAPAPKRETQKPQPLEGDYLGQCTDGETRQPVAIHRGPGGLLVAREPVQNDPAAVARARELLSPEPVQARPLALPAPLVEVEGPTGRLVAIEPEPQESEPAPAQEAPGYAITEQVHNKRGFTFYQVELAERIDRSLFNELRAACILANGWWNRPWAGAAGGFAFRDRMAAQAFANEHLGGPTGPQGPGPGRKDSEPAPAAVPPQATAQEAPGPNHAPKFRALADTMQGAIDDKFADRLENTPKRHAQAARARVEGLQLERAQVVLRRLADMWDAGAVPPLLQQFTSKRAIIEAMAAELEPVPNGYHGYQVEAQPLRPRQEGDAVAMLWNIWRQEPEALRDPVQVELANLLPRVRGKKIPGYFFTPPAVVERIHEAAAIEPYHYVLEPSAGDGALLEPLELDESGLVFACEINPELCEVLKLRGLDASPVDFLALPIPSAVRFDRVIMNPPFEKLTDCDHVRRAWEWLKEGGRLVAIMSPAWTFHDTQKAREFRAWVEELGGEWEELPPGSFVPAGTSVNTGMLTLRK